MKYVDMSATPDEMKDMINPSPPKYPYGLCISFCKDELEKLGLDIDDICVGDFLHLHSLAKVTSKSNNETEQGENPRMELVLAFVEVEDEGAEDEEEETKGRLASLYK